MGCAGSIGLHGLIPFTILSQCPRRVVGCLAASAWSSCSIPTRRRSRATMKPSARWRWPICTSWRNRRGSTSGQSAMSAEPAGKGDPLRWQRVWSIGIYSGSSPFNLAPAAPYPVLSAAQVSDADAYYVADPFMLEHEGCWHMYFEVLLRASRRGVIGVATSRDARTWAYRGLVLEQPFHLSYPQVFAHDRTIYMLPETIGAEAVRLYRAVRFPDRFEPVRDLIQGVYADPTIFFEGGLWWILACSTPYENRTLNLFFAERLLGPWQEHPRSPIVSDDRHIAR